VSPPLIVALTKSDLVKKYDLSTLQLLGCGGAPLGKEVAERFAAKFPNIEIVQVSVIINLASTSKIVSLVLIISIYFFFA